MSTIPFKLVAELPSELDPTTGYLTPDPADPALMQLAVSTKDGMTTRRIISKTDVREIVAEFTGQSADAPDYTLFYNLSK